MVTRSRNIGLSGLISATLLFSSGVLASNRLKYLIASRGAANEVPFVTVDYSSEGTFINKQRYANGRLGDARCDWKELAASDRATYAANELAAVPNVLNAYVRALPAERKELLVYTTLVQLARERGTTPGKQAEDIENAVGFKWNMVYEADTTKR